MKITSTDHKSYQIILGFLALFALPVLIVGIPVGALIGTSHPLFCRSCHEMKSDYQAWRQSKHYEVTCVACHVKPGIHNHLISKIRALDEIFEHVIDSYCKPINEGSKLSSQIPDKNCLPCHKTLRKIATKKMVYDHAIHEEEKLGCAYCHNRTGHPKMAEYQDHMAMDFCLDCHRKEEGPTTDCSKCHSKGFSKRPALHNTESWKSAHEEYAEHRGSNVCYKCHQKEFCNDCHSKSEEYDDD